MDPGKAYHMLLFRIRRQKVRQTSKLHVLSSLVVHMTSITTHISLPLILNYLLIQASETTSISKLKRASQGLEEVWERRVKLTNWLLWRNLTSWISTPKSFLHWLKEQLIIQTVVSLSISPLLINHGKSLKIKEIISMKRSIIDLLQEG